MAGMPPRGTADLHMHSTYGDGLNSVPEILDWVEHRTHLDVISITDHDDVRASLDARELAARRGYRFAVLVGHEVTTRDGHLLVYGVEAPLPPHRPADETAERARELGGWCIAPHPLSPMTASLRLPALKRLVATDALLGIELVNSSPAGRRGGDLARRYNDLGWNLAMTGGSDAHKRALIGSAYTEFEGRDACDLLRCLVSRRTVVVGRYWTPREVLTGAARVMGRAYFLLPARRPTRLRAHDAAGLPVGS